MRRKIIVVLVSSLLLCAAYSQILISLSLIKFNFLFLLKNVEQDVWQGTQLLAIDTAAATGLLRRVLIGDELTEKEKKILRRTLTDLASVFPIGVLMLLPVRFFLISFLYLYEHRNDSGQKNI